MKLRLFLCTLVFGTFLLAGLFSHSQTTNETSPGLQPLAPMKPLKPLKPLGSPGADKDKAPIKLGSFQNTQISQAFVESGTGRRIIYKYFRLQFKVLDPTVTQLDTAAVYLFNQKKELVGSLNDYSPTVKLTGGDVRDVVNVPNLLSALTGLEKNKTYNLIFMYEFNSIQFKYAVGVLGAKGVTVADTIPSSAKLDEFTFDGKDTLVQ